MNGHLWEGLNEPEQQELLTAYAESFDDQNLLDHDKVKVTHKKWLFPTLESHGSQIGK